MADVCEWCGFNWQTGGCHRQYAADKECMWHGKREDTLAEKIGRGILADLSDRRGIKQEIAQCGPDIIAEIRQTLGEIALRIIKESSGETLGETRDE